MGRYSGKSCRLSTMLLMTSSFFLVEIIVGYVTNSMALVADSFHMLSDVVSLLVGFLAVRIAKKKSNKNTFGWVRAEVMGALINAVFLVALCFTISVESLKRLLEVERIDNPQLILIVGSAGLVVNLIGMLLFREQGSSDGGSKKGKSDGGSNKGKSDGGSDKGKSGGGSSKGKSEKSIMGNGHSVHSLKVELKELPNGKPAAGPVSSIVVVDDDPDDDGDEQGEGVNPKIASSAQLNMRAVFLHVMGDALGSVIVIISALIIWFAEGDWKYYVDPAISLAMVAIIMTTTMPLLKESAMILLQRVPNHIKVDEIRSKLVKKVKGVLGVHELHVWRLAGNKVIASAHIQCMNIDQYMDIAFQVKEFFHNEGIHSTTIQPEFVEFTELDAGSNCILECLPKKCVKRTCCGKLKSSVGHNGSNRSSPTSNGGISSSSSPQHCYNTNV